MLLKHKGSCGQLQTGFGKKQRSLWDVIEHIEQKYKVVYRSMQSHLLKNAGMSWHKGRKSEAWTGSLIKRPQEKSPI